LKQKLRLFDPSSGRRDEMSNGRSRACSLWTRNACAAGNIEVARKWCIVDVDVQGIETEMNMFLKKLVVAGALSGAIVFSGAQTVPASAQSADPAAALFGGIVGGIVGSQIGSGEGQILGAIAGAFVGSLVASSIAASLEAEDQDRLNDITVQTLESGGSKSFKNKKTGTKAKTKIVKRSKGNSKQACATVRQEITTSDGKAMVDSVTACKGPNGWSV
jgi:outer membrane lipoprotein SlyB